MRIPTSGHWRYWYNRSYKATLAGGVAVPLLAMVAAPTLILPGSVVSAAAPMHLHLVKSEPAPDATFARSPREIRLIFSAPVALASLSLRDAADQVVTLGPVRRSVEPRLAIGQGPDSVVHNAGIVVAPLSQSLKPGVYHLTWKATGSDGHAVKNRLAFTVRAASAATPAAPAAAKGQSAPRPSQRPSANH